MFQFIIAVFCAAFAWGAAPEAPSSVGLRELVQIATQNNPRIKAVQKRWEVIRDQEPAAGTWEDPMIGFQRMNFQGGQNGNYLNLSQNIPFPGKLTQAQVMKRHEAMIAYQKYRAQVLAVVSQVSIAYARLLWLKESASALRKDSELLREIARAAQASVASGRATTDEALSARAAQIQVQDSAKEREKEYLIEEESLNALLSRPAGTQWNLKNPRAPQKLKDSPQELDAFAKKTSPEYLLALHQIMHARAMVSLGRLGFLPDFQLAVSQEIGPPIPMMQESVYGANVSIPLWFWKQESLLQSAKAHQKEARASSREALNELVREVHSEAIETDMRQELALSYGQEIIPLTQGALKIAEKGYETGQTSFAKLSEDVRALIDAQLKYYQEVELYGENVARLERAMGAPLATIQKGDSKP